MTLIDLIAVILICATALGCTYILAERWYAHRDRALQQLAASAQATLKQVRDTATELLSTARASIVQDLEAHRTTTTARVAELETVVQKHTDTLQSEAWKTRRH